MLIDIPDDLVSTFKNAVDNYTMVTEALTTMGQEQFEEFLSTMPPETVQRLLTSDRLAEKVHEISINELVSGAKFTFEKELSNLKQLKQIMEAAE